MRLKVIMEASGIRLRPGPLHQDESLNRLCFPHSRMSGGLEAIGRDSVA